METVIADRESVLNRRRPDRPHVVHSRDLAGRFRLTSKFISAKFVLCGEERYSGAFGRRQVVPGRYLLAASDAPLEVDIKPGSRGFCAYFDVESVAELLRDRVEGEVLPSPLADPNAWTTVLPVVGSQFGRELYDFAVSGKTTNHDYCCELLAEALAQFINTASRLSYRKDASRIENFSRLERARAYLSEEPDRTVTLQEAAREACMSQHRFVRAFSSAYGAPPLRYRQNFKLDMSREQLLQGKSVQQAADAVGFSSLSGFSRAYYRRHGRRPSMDAAK